MNKLFLIGGLAAVVAAGAALAQAPPPPPSPYGAPPPPSSYGRPGDNGRGFQAGERGSFGPGRFGAHRFGRRRMSLQEVERRNADMFAQADVNRDGRLTFEEFRQYLERRRMERQRNMFRRFSGGQDWVTLDQLNARAAERMGGRGRDGGDGGPQPPPPPRPDRPSGR